jgi:acetyl esterase/lipase
MKMKINIKVYGFIIGLIMVLVSWSQSFFINYLMPLGWIIIALCVVNMLVLNKSLKRQVYRGLVVTSSLVMVFEMLWMIFDKIELFAIAQILFVIMGLVFLGFGLGRKSKGKKNGLSILVTVIKWIFLSILTMISVALIVFTITPKPITEYLQNTAGNQNSYKAEPSKTITIDHKYQLKTNIRYGEKYPESYLNIITPKGKIDKNRPTYFYVHGGGFILGDAIGGDPNTAAKQNTTLYHYKKMIDHGYNVVAINYALAPQYTHPTPVKQLSQSVKFMQKNSKKLGINMDKVVFAGGSAGGHIVAEFATIQANHNFAKKVKITPVIKLKNIKALVLESPALDTRRGHKTQKENVVTDYIFAQSMGAYLNQPVVSGDKQVIDFTNMISKATSNFPPTFISDGNTATFADQAEDYYHRLKELGVKTDLYIPDINKVKAGHGFMAQDVNSKETKIYLERKFDFLDEIN